MAVSVFILNRTTPNRSGEERPNTRLLRLRNQLGTAL